MFRHLYGINREILHLRLAKLHNYIVILTAAIFTIYVIEEGPSQ